MCQVVETSIGNRKIHVADIKMKYLANIVDAARKCDYIDKVVMFGSACGDRCRETSDIDLAVFGNQTKYKCLISKKYRAFLEQIYSFDNHNQAYDFLYFKTGDKDQGRIMEDIEKGEILYVR